MELSSVARTSRMDLEADVSGAYNGGTDLPHLRSPYAQNRDTDSVAGPAEARAAEAATLPAVDGQIYADLGLVDLLDGVQVSIVHNVTEEQLLLLVNCLTSSALQMQLGLNEVPAVTYIPENSLTREVSSQLDAVASLGTQILQHEGWTNALPSTVIEQSCDQVTPKRSHKRQRNVDGWKSIKRHKLTQSGQEYVSIRGKVVPAKCMTEHKSDCSLTCEVSSQLDAVASLGMQILQHEGWTNALPSTVIEQSCDQVTPKAKKCRWLEID